MKYLAYMNILFGDNHVRTVEIGEKRGDAMRYHPKLVLPSGVKNKRVI
jgi:prepilin-type processing-associated H-X9-DG protein